MNGDRNSSPDLSTVVHKWSNAEVCGGGGGRTCGNDNDADDQDNDDGGGVCSETHSKEQNQRMLMEMSGGFQNMEPISCELCGDMFVMPVPYHMATTHPGCGQSSGGHGYAIDGVYKSDWPDSISACGGSSIACYMLCEQCRGNYMQKRRGRSVVPGSDRYRKTAALSDRWTPVAASDDPVDRRKPQRGESSSNSL